MNKRCIYLFIVICLVIVGLASREISWIPAETGDVLWAMMLFCLVRISFIKMRLAMVAILSLVLSFADEFAQLIQWPWLVAVRSTTLGHLILGQGFLWEDLLAYTTGIGIAYLIAKMGENALKRKYKYSI